MAMQKIKTGDAVIVISGRSKGERGVVTRVFFDGSGKLERVLIEGVHMVHHYVKADKENEDPGGIRVSEAPVHISNVMIYNRETEKPDRIGIKMVDGKKCRYFKSNGALVDTGE